MSEDTIDERSGSDLAPKKLSLLAKLRIAGLVIAGVLIVIVVARNWQAVTIDILGIKATMPQAIMVMLTFLFGLAVGVLLAFLRPWRKRD